MAFTVTGREIQLTGFSPAATITTESFTPTANSLLLGFGHCAGDDSTAMNEALPAAPFTDTASLSWTELESYEGTAAPAFGAGDGFRQHGVLMYANVGGSPASMTVTFDAFDSALNGTYSITMVDVTGHNTSTPFVQTAKAGESKSGGDGEFFTITLPSTPVVGNLVIVSFGSNNDAGGAFAPPTLGDQAMVEVYNPDGGPVHNGVWYRIVDGAELSNDILCNDLGDAVGSVVAFAAEIALFTGPPPDLLLPIVQSPLRLG